jgi:protein required for attachment to host cells
MERNEDESPGLLASIAHRLALAVLAGGLPALDRINKVALSGAFNQLVIVAPPKILGDLRRKFTKETETKIIAEVPKDLTHHTIPEIERLLTAE